MRNPSRSARAGEACRSPPRRPFANTRDVTDKHESRYQASKHRRENQVKSSGNLLAGSGCLITLAAPSSRQVGAFGQANLARRPEQSVDLADQGGNDDGDGE
jgi:hypothetical protein